MKQSESPHSGPFSKPTLRDSRLASAVSALINEISWPPLINKILFYTCIRRCLGLVIEIRMIVCTVFDLITAHTPIRAQSRNSVGFRLQPVYFFLYFFTKAYVVGTHLNCIDKSMQFKWVPTTYAFVGTHLNCRCNSNEYPQHMPL